MSYPLANAPVLTTERLILRVPRAGDFRPWAEFAMSDRARHVGGPLTRALAWRSMCHLTGHWVHRGFGMFIFSDRSAPDTPLGMSGPWFPEGWPEREIGWSVWNPAAEGRGFAFEAARAARKWARDRLGWTGAVSYIDRENTRSQALARRMGAVVEAGAAIPDFGETDDPTQVWRHPPAEAWA
ncbi:MAG: GNAT family N-acetyltransferase [Pseudomonadota bacterium]|jgi:RimJ/RimL family protein N-acetyltransferase